MPRLNSPQGILPLIALACLVAGCIVTPTAPEMDARGKSLAAAQ